MTTELTRPEPLFLQIKREQYGNLETYLPLKLAELADTPEQTQRLAWWQKYGIQGVGIFGGETSMDVNLKYFQKQAIHFDLALQFEDGLVAESLANKTSSKTLPVLPLHRALAAIHQTIGYSATAATELRHFVIVDGIFTADLRTAADIKGLAECFPMLTHLHVDGLEINLSEFIYLAQLNQLTQLDLINNEIAVQGAVALAKPLAKLTQLTQLSLVFNNIGDQGMATLAKPLAQLSQLTQLNLRRNNIGAQGVAALAKPLVKMTQLSQLDLGGNKIGARGAVTLAKPLAQLTQLTQLDLGGNKIGEQGANALAKPLAQLTQLTGLDLTGNLIEDQGLGTLVKPLAQLTQLTRLGLHANNIGKHGAIALAKSLTQLNQLTRLDLGGNKIGEHGAAALAKPLAQLTQLTRLDIGGNKIGAQGAAALATPLTKLTQLTQLYLNYNNIGDQGAVHLAMPLAKLTQLTELDLSDNTFTDLTPLLTLLKRGITINTRSYADGLAIGGCPITTPPPEIVHQGREAIINYYQERQAQDTVRLREAKLLIVGEPGVGKTSLVRRLTKDKQGLPTEAETTKGIDIATLQVSPNNGEPIKLNIWDFGGQEIYHATHQFFLTKRSLYVLVDSSRSNDNGSNTGLHDERYRYWLDVVASLSDSSPLLLFQNQLAGRSKYMDIPSIKGEYHNVQCNDAGDLADATSISSLQQNLIHHAAQLPHINDEIPSQWLAIREALATLADPKGNNRAHITFNEYLALYRQHIDKDRADPAQERQKALFLSSYLHDLGIFLHFQHEPALAKTVILQNTWATEAVFKVLDDEDIKRNNGRFTLADCQRIWHQPNYQDMHSELLALLEKFEICYKLPPGSGSQVDVWLTPQLLQEQPPSLQALQQELQSPQRAFPVMCLHYQYHFLPRGIISRLMVRMHRYINDPNQSWNKGVLFQLHKSRYAEQHQIDNSSLLIQLTSKANEIALIAFGPEAKTLQGIIAAELDELNHSFAGLKDKVQQRVPCVCSQCKNSVNPHFYDAKLLSRYHNKGLATIVCEKSLLDVPVAELLQGLPEKPTKKSPETNNSTTSVQTLTLFLASSSELKAARDAFHLFLAQQNDRLVKQGIYIELIRWEHFLDAISKQGLQNEYNKQVRSSDIFVSLFKTKVGKYTEEEFDQAFAQFSQTQTPKIYTYFYQGDVNLGQLNQDDMNSLFNFQNKLKEQGHYHTNFEDINDLKQQFRHQLDMLLPTLIPTGR